MGRHQHVDQMIRDSNKRRTDGQTYRRIQRHRRIQRDKRTDGRTDGWTERRKDKQTPETLTIRSPPPAEIDNWNEAKLTPQASTVLPGTPWLYRVLQNFLSLYRQICLVPLQTPRILKHGKLSRSASHTSTILIDERP